MKRPNWIFIAIPFLIATVTFLVYYPSLNFGLVYDDEVFVDPSNLSIRVAFTRLFFCNYSPLPQLTYVLDFAIWGGSAFGYHLTNLIFHICTVVAFYFLCLELYLLSHTTIHDRFAAATSALFFGLHPLRLQSVAWISERRDVVSGLLFIVTLLLWLRSYRPRQLHAPRWRLASLATFLLALLSKASTVPLPAILLLMAITPLGQMSHWPWHWGERTARTVWRQTAPFFLLSAALTPFFFLGQKECGAIDIMHLPLEQKALELLAGLFFYSGKTLWPTQLSFYEWHWLPIRTATLLGLTATVALIGAAFVFKKMRPYLLAALFFQMIMLAPTLMTSLGHEIVADRYTYLSGLAWAVLFGAALRSSKPILRRSGLFTALAILTLLTISTRAQIGIWKNSTTLWRNALKLDPLSAVARQNLAAAVLNDGRLGEAILLLEEHLRLYPGDLQTRARLNQLIATTGITTRDHARFHEELGREFESRGELSKAAWHFKKALDYSHD